MKKIVLLLLFMASAALWASDFSHAEDGNLQADAMRLETVDPGFGHGHAHVGVIAGVVTGWGWWGIGFPAYGYSYYPYWNYQPYYATYAAIAYSPSTGAPGVAWGFGSRWFAENEAYRYCGEADCQTVAWVQGGCAALSRSADGNVLGWGVSTTRYNARSVAQRGCRANGGIGCRQLAWTCSY